MGSIYMLIAIYLVIGFLISKFWYNKRLEKIDENILKNYGQELNPFEVCFWSVAMFLFWPILFPYEDRTDFNRWKQLQS